MKKKNVLVLNGQIEYNGKNLYDSSTDNQSFQKESNDKHLIREKIEAYGIEKLVSEEVLSVLTGINVDRCREYILKYGFSEIIKYLDVLNITPVQRQKLTLLFNFCYRVNTDTRSERPQLSSSSEAGSFFVNHLKFEKNEKFLMGCLNARNRLISLETISVGTVDQAQVYAREVIRVAIGNNAVSVLFAHNHPGSSLEASHADVNLTKQLKNTLEAISIKIVDHIIVAGNNYMSFANRGLL